MSHPKGPGRRTRALNSNPNPTFSPIPSRTMPHDSEPNSSGRDPSGRPRRSSSSSRTPFRGERDAERSGEPRSSVRESIEVARDAGGMGGFGGGSTHRVAQVSTLIARVLQERLARGLNDPRVQGMVSIVGVDCTPDLATAHVRVSVLPAERSRLTLSGLRSATRHLEGIVRKATRLRKVPRLVFDIDDSMKREAALTESLSSARGTTETLPSDVVPDDQTSSPGEASDVAAQVTPDQISRKTSLERPNHEPDRSS